MRQQFDSKPLCSAIHVRECVMASGRGASDTGVSDRQVILVVQFHYAAHVQCMTLEVTFQPRTRRSTHAWPRARNFTSETGFAG